MQTLHTDTAPVGREKLLLLVLLLCGILIAPPRCCRVYPGELGPKHWPNSRYEHVMKLKQAALTFARKRWADYILVTSSAPAPPRLIGYTSFNPKSLCQSLSPTSLSQFADTDNILTDPDTLNHLIAENKSVVAPMLDSTGAYSNFWCGITPQVRP